MPPSAFQTQTGRGNALETATRLDEIIQKSLRNHLTYVPQPVLHADLLRLVSTV